MDNLRKDCWDNALHAFGTSYIFRTKAEKYKKLISSLKFFGLAVPVTVGLVALAYGYNSDLLKWTIFIATPLTIIQFFISLIATIKHWDSELSYSYESASENIEIAMRYESLAKYPPKVKDSFEKEIEILKTLQSSRDKQDDKHSVTEKDERKGMRYALRNYRRECSSCGKVPTSMIPSYCNVCGNF